jgi:hypothetical protein
MQGQQTQHPSRSEQVYTIQARIRVSSQGMPTNLTLYILGTNQQLLIGRIGVKVFLTTELKFGWLVEIKNN